MSNITLFSFGTREIRVTDQNGDPWFILRDLLEAMETSTPVTVAIESIKQGLGDGFNNVIPILDSLRREQNATIVAESAATYLLSRSNTEKGRELNRFIHVDVLPSIRKTGSYKALSNTLLAAQIAELFQGKVLVDTEILHTLRHRLDGVESIFQQLGAQLHQNPPRSTPNNVVQLFNKPSQAKLNRQNWEKPVQAFLANRTETTVTEVLNHIGVEPTHGHKKHMAQLLKSMNWQVNVILRANRTTRVYRFG